MPEPRTTLIPPSMDEMTVEDFANLLVRAVPPDVRLSDVRLDFDVTAEMNPHPDYVRDATPIALVFGPADEHRPHRLTLEIDYS